MSSKRLPMKKRNTDNDDTANDESEDEEEDEDK
jgi:hypothetical protein